MDAAAIAATRPDYLWHVALTFAGQDKQAVDALRHRKYRVYRPCYEFETRWRNKRAWRQRSLFPGYLFVLPHPTAIETPAGWTGWELLRESPGVYDLMQFNGRVAALRDDDPDFRRIEAIEAELRKMPQKTSEYRVGQQVLVKKGPFIDFLGVIAALDDDKKRADILAGALKRKFRAVSFEYLNPA